MNIGLGRPASAAGTIIYPTNHPLINSLEEDETVIMNGLLPELK